MLVTADTEIVINASPEAIWDYAADPENWTASNPQEHHGLRFCNTGNRPATGVAFRQQESVAGVEADLRGRVLLADKPRLLVWTGMATYKLLGGLLRIGLAEGGVLTLDRASVGTRLSHNVYMNFPDSPWGRMLRGAFVRLLDGQQAVYDHTYRELVFFKHMLEGGQDPGAANPRGVAMARNDERSARGDFTTHDEVRDVYRRRAARYDVSANLYYLIGFREHHHRRRAVAALGLRPGDTVVEIGCGTGLNFALLQRVVGPRGRIVGVDLTDAMLAEARKRVRANGWTNVELVESDAAAYCFPQSIDGVISTFALTLEAEYDRVIAAAARALKPGKRFVLLDIKLPDNWLRPFAPLLIFLVRPFAVSMTVARRRPWLSMQRHLKNVTVEAFYGGIGYISSGEA